MSDEARRLFELANSAFDAAQKAFANNDRPAFDRARAEHTAYAELHSRLARGMRVQ